LDQVDDGHIGVVERVPHVGLAEVEPLKLEKKKKIRTVKKHKIVVFLVESHFAES
jgi:hypothetical protein